MRPSRRVLIFILILFLAVFLRLYKFSELTSFWLDQAIDLLVARRALVDGVWPLVGPYLSVGKFSVPPTYFYLLIFFLWFGKTPEGTALFFVLLDLAAMVFLYLLARQLLDEWLGLIVAFLYAVSFVMILHARSMWQPHPVQVFLIASLLSLITAYKKRSFMLLVLSIFLYALATSIYPSPIVLLPFFIARAIYFFRKIKHTAVVASIGKSVVLIGACYFLTFSPMIVFEAIHGWPTYSAIFTSSFGFPSALQAIQEFGISLFGLFLSFSWLKVVHPLNFILYVLFFSVLFVFVITVIKFQRNPGLARYREALSFFSLPTLTVGLISLLLFRDMMNIGWPWYRLYGFLPFLFLLFGLVIRFAFAYKRFWYRMLIFVLVFLFILGNGLTFFQRIIYASDISQAQRARNISSYIYGKVVDNKLRKDDIFITAYAPTGDWSSYIYPELYFLWEKFDWRVVFNEYGNNLPYRGNDPPRKYALLLCREFWSIDDIYGICLRDFAKRFPGYRLIDQKLFPVDTVIFTLRKEENTIIPGSL